jgi:hypothetical protein
MMEAARTSETSVDSYFTRRYIPEDNSERRSTSSKLQGAKSQKAVIFSLYSVSSKSVLEMGRYTVPELLFVPEFHTGTYQYILIHIFSFHFSDGSAFKKYTGSSKLSFRALAKGTVYRFGEGHGTRNVERGTRR